MRLMNWCAHGRIATRLSFSYYQITILSLLCIWLLLFSDIYGFVSYCFCRIAHIWRWVRSDGRNSICVDSIPIGRNKRKNIFIYIILVFVQQHLLGYHIVITFCCATTRNESDFNPKMTLSCWRECRYSYTTHAVRHEREREIEYHSVIRISKEFRIYIAVMSFVIGWLGRQRRRI